MTTPTPQHRADGATAPAAGTGQSTTGQAKDTAKDQARQTAGVAGDQAKQAAGSAADHAKQTAGTAAEQARNVAGTAKDEAGHVVAEATQQARDLVGELGSQVSEQSRQQRDRLVALLQSTSDELEQMAGASEAKGLAADVARQLATRTRAVSTHLDDHEPSELLDQVRRYARRRPGAFLLGAAAAGLLAGRLTKAARSDHHESTGPNHRAAGPAVPAVPARTTAVSGTSGLDADVRPVAPPTRTGPAVDPVEPGLAPVPGRTPGARL